MTASKPFPPITLITGPRKSGRTTYAVLVGSSLFTQGIPFYHNGTALFGWFWDDYLRDPNGLPTLDRRIPPNLPILIEEADIHPATRQADDPSHDQTIALALAALVLQRRITK